MAVPLVEHKLKLLPDLPGCYEMLNYAGKIIYVGKSKDLKHRVRSYFKAQHYGKVGKMVSQVRNFHTIYVSNDNEAFLLEITLIQKYRPYFNIQLKQGHESYPYIEITNQRNPKITMTRQIKQDGAMYFGPYSDVTAAEKTVRFLQHVYPLARGNGYHHSPCLYFHMGDCLGNCFRKVPRAVYQEQLKHIRTFLNGNCTPAKKLLMHRMQYYAKHLKFEKAEQDKKLLQYIETTVQGQKIISNNYTPRDVFNYYAKNGWLCVQLLIIRQARVMGRIRRYIPIMDDAIDDALIFLVHFYHNPAYLLPKELFIPKQMPRLVLHKALHISVRTPERGQQRALLNMAYTNAKISLNTKFELLTFNHTRTLSSVKQLSKLLHIPYAEYIDSMDHAYIQGRDNVSAFIVYKDGQPDKKLYRKYKLHTGHADEFADTVEVMRRRYTRKLKENKPMPNLIAVDGGEIQKHAADQVVHHELHLHIPIVGMVKNSKHQSDFLIFGSDNTPIHLSHSSDVFFLISRIQTDIHNYVINYHRHVHSKHEIHSGLDMIPGVGNKTRNKLFRHFGSINHIRNATINDIHKLGIPINTAKNIKFSLAKH